MTYFDRRPQLLATLRSIALSSVKDKEVIIIDDGSSYEHLIDDLQPMFDFKIITKRVERFSLGSTPSAAYNFGFFLSSGNIILIQNPENIHFGDVLKYAAENTVPNNYLLFSCRNLDATKSQLLWSLPILSKESIQQILCDHTNDFCNLYPRRRETLNWCASILRKDLQELNGFDERFSRGRDFDDDEFYTRIVRKGMQIKILDETCPFVFHQEHTTPYYGSGYLEGHKHNKAIFELVQKETTYRANADKEVVSCQ